MTSRKMFQRRDEKRGGGGKWRDTNGEMLIADLNRNS